MHMVMMLELMVTMMFELMMMRIMMMLELIMMTLLMTVMIMMMMRSHLIADNVDAAASSQIPESDGFVLASTAVKSCDG